MRLRTQVFVGFGILVLVLAALLVVAEDAATRVDGLERRAAYEQQEYERLFRLRVDAAQYVVASSRWVAPLPEGRQAWQHARDDLSRSADQFIELEREDEPGGPADSTGDDDVERLVAAVRAMLDQGEQIAATGDPDQARALYDTLVTQTYRGEFHAAETIVLAGIERDVGEVRAWREQAMARLRATSRIVGGSVLVALLAGGALLGGTLTRGTRALLAGAEKIARGDLDLQVGLRGTDEFATIARAMEHTSCELAAHRAAGEAQRAELELRVGELRAARDVALAANRAKSSFLANMSHELRTPLNAILGYAELAAEEVTHDASGTQADLERITIAGTHLLKLINDVLDLAKIEADRIELELGDVDLRGLADRLRTTVRPLVDRNRNRLEIEVVGGETVRCDEGRVTQIAMNLLGNAAKFTCGGIVRLTLRVDEPDGRPTLVLAVSDTGIGIAADKLAAIFDEYAQADVDTRRTYGGLGLAISRRLAERMGGTVTVASTPQVGSTFTLTVPVARSPTARAAA